MIVEREVVADRFPQSERLASQPQTSTDESVDARLPEEQLRSNLVVIRAQHMEDMVEVREIVQRYHSESRYAHLPFSERKFIRHFEKAMSRPNDTISLYVKHNGRTVALLNAGAGDYYLGEGGRLVTVYAMYVDRPIRHSALGGRIGLKLMRAAFDWAKSQNAVELHVHSTSGISPERTDRFLRRLGFGTYGGNYAAPII